MCGQVQQHLDILGNEGIKVSKNSSITRLNYWFEVGNVLTLVLSYPQLCV